MNFRSAACSPGRSLPWSVNVFALALIFTRPVRSLSVKACSIWRLYSAAAELTVASDFFGAGGSGCSMAGFEAVTASAGALLGVLSREEAGELSAGLEFSAGSGFGLGDAGAATGAAGCAEGVLLLRARAA